MGDPITAALIGGGASLIGSGIQAYTNYKAQQEELEQRKKAADELRRLGQITDQEYNNLISQINAYYENRGSLGQEEDVNAYRKAIYGYNPEDYVENGGKEYSADDFQSKLNREDFVNPYYGRIIGNTADQIQHTAAGAGIGRGTGAALNIAKGVAEKSDELYRTANQDYQNERNFEYQKYIDAIRNNQQRLQGLQSGQQYRIGQLGNLATDYFNTQDTAMADELKARQDKMNAQTAYSTAIAGLY